MSSHSLPSKSTFRGVPPKPLFNPKLMIILTIIFGLFLLISAFLEIQRSHRELAIVLNEQARSMMSLAQRGLDNAALSFSFVEQLVENKLLDNARHLERLDRAGLLSEKVLRQVAAENNLFRIQVFDSGGRRVLSNFTPLGPGSPESAPRPLLQPILQQESDELVLGFRGGVFGIGERFAVAKRRQKGGAIIVNMDAGQMLAFRREIGVGQFIKKLGDSEGVAFAMVQDTLQVLMASSGVRESVSILEDPFLSAAWNSDAPSMRFTDFGEQEVYEIIQKTRMPESGSALLRIGLTTEHLRQAESQARRRVVIVSGLLLVVGVLIANVLLSGQNYRALRQAYTRMEGYTGGILANMTDAVIAVDPQQRFILINRAAEELFGINSAELAGKSCESLPPICLWLEEALLSGKDHPPSINRIERQGRMLDLETSVTVLRDESGNHDVAFAVIKDLTEEKRLQAQIKRQEQIAAMGHLASGVAHEVRNPLNAISMIAQRLHSEFTATQDEEEFKQLTVTLSQETRRINEIIQQFLQFTRPPQLNKASISLDQIAMRAAAIIRPEAQARDISFTLHCRPVARIEGDADKLQQVLINLLHNSLHACKGGDEIILACEMDRGMVRLQVKDTGEGIAMEDLGKIFNLYFTTREIGSGLGLSIVQQIISQHDGRIEVESEKNKGTRFSIFLKPEE